MAEGPPKGRTLAQLMERSPKQILGKFGPTVPTISPATEISPDAQKMSSVQVHPRDGQATLIPGTARPARRRRGSFWKRVPQVAGLRRPEAQAQTACRSARPSAGDRGRPSGELRAPARAGRFSIEAGAVHAARCDGVVVFEVQENSDVTTSTL